MRMSNILEDTLLASRCDGKRNCCRCPSQICLRIYARSELHSPQLSTLLHGNPFHVKYKIQNGASRLCGIISNCERFSMKMVYWAFARHARDDRNGRPCSIYRSTKPFFSQLPALRYTSPVPCWIHAVLADRCHAVIAWQNSTVIKKQSMQNMTHEYASCR